MMQRHFDALARIDGLLSTPRTPPADRAALMGHRALVEAEIHLEQGDARHARALAVAAVAAAHGQTETAATVWANVVAAEAARGDDSPEDALKAADWAIEIARGTLVPYDPLVRRALFVGGQALAAMGETTDALNYFQMYIQLSAHDAPEERIAAAVRAGTSLLAADAQSEALVVMQEAARITDEAHGAGSHSALRAQIVAQMVNGLAGADAEARVRLSALTADAVALDALAILHSAADRHEEAAACSQAALAAHTAPGPARAVSLHTAALVGARNPKTKTTAALEAYQRALEASVEAGLGAAVVSRIAHEAALVAPALGPAAGSRLQQLIALGADGRLLAKEIGNLRGPATD